MPFIIQQANTNGLFPNPTTIGSFIIVGVAAGGGEATNTSYQPPAIGQIGDSGNTYATNLSTSRDFQGSTDSSGIALAASWSHTAVSTTGVSAVITPFPSGITQSAIFAYEIGGLLAHDVDTTVTSGTGSFTTSFENEFVYTLQGSCIPSGTFTPSYTVTREQTASFASGLAGGSDGMTFNVGAFGTYSISVSGYYIGLAMAFRTNSTAVPNGVSASFVIHAPTGKGNANRAVTGVTFASAEHAPIPQAGAVTTGIAITAAEHNPTAKGDGNADTSGVSMESDEGTPFAHSGKQGFNPRWVSH
jgi:hypothetical protein